MALRAFGSQFSIARSFASAPTVFDKMVQLFVIDKAGTRHTMRALEGNTLAQALREYGQFEDGMFMPNPWTAAPDCHVYVHGEYLSKLPKLNEEQLECHDRLIEDFVRDKARENSRMANYIPLTPALNGMTIALGEIEPWQTW